MGSLSAVHISHPCSANAIEDFISIDPTTQKMDHDPRTAIIVAKQPVKRRSKSRPSEEPRLELAQSRSSPRPEASAVTNSWSHQPSILHSQARLTNREGKCHQEQRRLMDSTVPKSKERTQGESSACLYLHRRQTHLPRIGRIMVFVNQSHSLGLEVGLLHICDSLVCSGFRVICFWSLSDAWRFDRLVISKQPFFVSGFVKQIGK